MKTMNDFCVCCKDYWFCKCRTKVKTVLEKLFLRICLKRLVCRFVVWKNECSLCERGSAKINCAHISGIRRIFSAHTSFPCEGISSMLIILYLLQFGLCNSALCALRHKEVWRIVIWHFYAAFIPTATSAKLAEVVRRILSNMKARFEKGIFLVQMF